MSTPVHFIAPPGYLPTDPLACESDESDGGELASTEPVRVRGCDVCVAAAARYAAREGMRLPVGVTHVTVGM